MKPAAAVVVLVSLAAGVAFLFRPSGPPANSNTEVQTIWNQQLKAVAEGQSTQIVMPDFRIPARCLSDLKSVAERVTELNLAGDSLATKLDVITACSHLKILHLRTELGDAEVARLAQLRELEVLDLPLALDMTNAGLKSLDQHPRLKLIRLRSPQVTDEGLQVFSQLPNLRWLHLMEVPVTDAGLEILRQMAQLESLYLDGDRATDEGLSKLILERPDLHFHRDQLHLPDDPRQRDGHQD